MTYSKCAAHDQERCWTCTFWEAQAQSPVNAVIVADHHHYRILPESPVGTPPQARGFAGTEFVVRFFDGRVVTTHNMWHQGYIEEGWRDRLRPNARVFSVRDGVEHPFRDRE